MRFNGAITFESDSQPPRVYRTEIDLVNPARAASQLVREAKRAHPGIRWSSLCLTLEKIGEDEANPTGDPKRGLPSAESEAREILERARKEVESLPEWKLSYDVKAELDKLK